MSARPRHDEVRGARVCLDTTSTKCVIRLDLCRATLRVTPFQKKVKEVVLNRWN